MIEIVIALNAWQGEKDSEGQRSDQLYWPVIKSRPIKERLWADKALAYLPKKSSR